MESVNQRKSISFFKWAPKILNALANLLREVTNDTKLLALVTCAIALCVLFLGYVAARGTGQAQLLSLAGIIILALVLFGEVWLLLRDKHRSEATSGSADLPPE